jgi:hypothetical protein
MAGIKENVLYQLPRLCAVECAVKMRREKYRNILVGMPCSGSKHCPQGLAETGTWRPSTVCVDLTNCMLRALGEEEGCNLRTTGNTL